MKRLTRRSSLSLVATVSEKRRHQRWLTTSFRFSCEPGGSAGLLNQ